MCQDAYRRDSCVGENGWKRWLYSPFSTNSPCSVNIGCVSNPTALKVDILSLRRIICCTYWELINESLWTLTIEWTLALGNILWDNNRRYKHSLHPSIYVNWPIPRRLENTKEAVTVRKISLKNSQYYCSW